MKNNIAVVGCGHWGKNLVRNFSELKALSAVCDPNTELAAKFATQFNVNNLSFPEVINDSSIEGVVLAVPAPLHASLAIEAMNAGKHVYVEKPLAMNKNEAKNMINAASSNKVNLMVGHLLQYHPIFIKVRAIVESGKLGQLSYIYSNRLSFGKVRSEEDVIWSFAPHDISMILSLAKEEPQLVKTESSCILQKNIADIATVHIKFKSGLKAHISVSWLHPYKEHKLVIVGELGMLIFDDTLPWNSKLAYYNHNIDLKGEIPQLDKSDVEFIEIEESEPLKNECRHFIDVVNQEMQPITDGDEGLRVLKVLTAATVSQASKLYEEIE
jgi:UDP-2-acetamido-3-amino-2,3-dideoxy-glucuronate N-acetyltransferase